MKNRSPRLSLLLIVSILALIGCESKAVLPTETATTNPVEAPTEVPSASGSTVVSTATPTRVSVTPEDATGGATANWQIYRNEKYGYSFKYFADCHLGPMPEGCKKAPPAERDPECLCFLDGDNPNHVFLQACLGNLDHPTLLTWEVSHFETPAFNPPQGADLVAWMREKWSSYEDTPDEPNTDIGGMPAVRYLSPQSPMAPSVETIYFMKDAMLFEIRMLSVEEGNNRELYDQMVSSFSTFEVS